MTQKYPKTKYTIFDLKKKKDRETDHTHGWVCREPAVGHTVKSFAAFLPRK